MSDNHLISIVTEANRHPGEYVLSLSVSNSAWAQTPFEIDEDELARIDEDFNHADIVGTFSGKKEAVRSERSAYIKNIIQSIDRLGFSTNPTVKSCKKEIKAIAEKVSKMNMSVVQAEYKSYPLTKKEKEQIRETFRFSSNKKKGRCFSVLK